MATPVALVSILCRDRIGLVAAVADCLFGAGVNLRDTSFAVIGGGAELTAACDLPPDTTLEEIEASLRELPELKGAQIRVSPYDFDAEPTNVGRITHRITVGGGDQLGLVARLAEIFAQYRANIVRMEARKLSPEEGGLYVTRFAVWIDEAQADSCLAAVGNTAGSLGLSWRVEAGDRAPPASDS
jgi:glycine cleavage system transcriptional repressor